MNWLVNAKPGDRFRWNRTGDVCKIVEIYDLEVRFVYLDGPREGQFGYTTLPQDVTLLTVLDDLAEI